MAVDGLDALAGVVGAECGGHVVESIESVEPVKEAPETSSGRIQAMMRGRAVRQEVSLLRPCCGLCCI